ncbi:AMP-binding enzyme family protein [Methyloversatilis sp. RAC08]|uniref:acyl-CoA ligase (AMP-forming), exosortase A system-associated n=1 Tax=Methyloversatilis sp. RAC08 TaxID=1842540 RepID=UPI00083DB12E|nr:acyl-CoA ligase (AMP-forming), exosortase A system-associated [Methyloversatilis sp. RAC08]AOF80466.1 AMP-binding enzyme family protein [Methyloversatilis sp. RAC08]
MSVPTLLNHLVEHAAARDGDACALRANGVEFSYTMLAQQVQACAHGLLELGVRRGDRVGIFLEKRFEAVVASFGTAACGAVFVPINPLLKAAQVGHIMRDSGARILITSAQRLAALGALQQACPALAHVVLVDGDAPGARSWMSFIDGPARALHRVIDSDVAAILYTSGSTGQPKGVVLSHRNMVSGACSVASYLGNHAGDTLLAALPLSFDAGFSQLTTGFLTGARVVLINYLMARDVVNALAAERVTGLTAVPPLYMQIVQLPWPASIDAHLRYFASTGGRMPRVTLDALRTRVPSASPFLMYGLTEAFRATYLPPEQVDVRPDSIGRAIPNAEVLVLREDGSPCLPGEPGELVQRGPLVAQGYWNDATRTAERFRPLPDAAGVRPYGLMQKEIAVFSGDTVRTDEDGFLYFVGRRDDMIKTSGYRVSPTEVEESLLSTGRVSECVAFGVADPELGQVIAVALHFAGSPDVAALRALCRAQLPAYQVPAHFIVFEDALPRNPNGKLDRTAIEAEARCRLNLPAGRES